MSRVVTLRLPDEVYELFRSRAKADNRPLSNLIETAAIRHLQEEELVAPEEMREILADRSLVRRLRQGSKDARAGKGRLVG
ncbi:MAG: CopG family transcriptional regulator [bacterium]